MQLANDPFLPGMGRFSPLNYHCIYQALGILLFYLHFNFILWYFSLFALFLRWRKKERERKRMKFGRKEVGSILEELEKGETWSKYVV